jgi:hypothetical protein
MDVARRGGGIMDGGRWTLPMSWMPRAIEEVEWRWHCGDEPCMCGACTDEEAKREPRGETDGDKRPYVTGKEERSRVTNMHFLQAGFQKSHL